MTDLRMTVEGTTLAIRAVLLCQRGGRVLVKSGDYPFHNLPGGAAQLWETLEGAAAREWHEETGRKAGSLRPVGLVENFFELQGRRWHELGFYYRMDAEDGLPDEALNVVDKSENVLTWINPAGSDKPLCPTAALSLLDVPPGEFRHIVHREGDTQPGPDVRLDLGGTNLQVRVHLIYVQGGYLLTNTEPGSGFWFLPGGSVQLHEDSLSAAYREFHEETGVQATSARLVGITEGFDHRNRRQQLGLCYRVEAAQPLPLTPRPVQDHETLHLDWVPLPDIKARAVQPAELGRMLDLPAGQAAHVVLHWNTP